MNFIWVIFYTVLGIASTASANWKVGLSVGYSPNYLVNMKGTGVASGTPYTADYNLSYSSSTEYGVDIWYAPKNAWGFISGYQHSGERKIISSTFNGSIQNVSSNTSKYQTHFVYLGTCYRWQSFYLPLGFTYGISKYTSGSAIDYEFKSGLGAHLGLGWFIGEHVVIEYIGRSSLSEYRATSGADSETLTGTVASALLSFKVFY